MRALVLATAILALTQGRPGGEGRIFPFPPAGDSPRSGMVHYPEETRLANVKQLTFGGMNAEAYFSFDDQRITFQATNWGTKCDQIFQFNLTDGAMSPDEAPEMVSTGKGRATCSFFYPDGERIMYASTHNSKSECPPAPCDNPKSAALKQACSRNGTYLWSIDPNLTIFVANRTTGEVLDQLTHSYGYQAEAVVSPKGDRISYTSMYSGDPEIWTMNPDGTEKRQITKELGYDGGSFFSPDGQKLVWRASRPKTNAEIQEYEALKKANVVSPTKMEIFVGPASGRGRKPQQVTNLGAASWAPYWHPDNERIIFASNFNKTNNDSESEFNRFNLYMVPESGNVSEMEQITFDSRFDSFPMFTHKAPWRLIWASARNSTKSGEMNLFIADWVSEETESTTGTMESTTGTMESTTGTMESSTGTTAQAEQTTTGASSSKTTENSSSKTTQNPSGKTTDPSMGTSGMTGTGHSATATHSWTENTTKGSGVLKAMTSVVTFMVAAFVAAH